MPLDIQRTAATKLPAQQNSICTLNINTTPSVVDLTSLPQYGALVGTGLGPNPVGHWVRITVSAGTAYYATGNMNQVNALANINAAAVSTLNATTHQVAVNGYECEPLFNTQSVDLYVEPKGTPEAQNPSGGLSPCRYVSLVTLSSTALVTIRQVGP